MGILNRLQGMWSWLTSDPVGFIVYIVYFAVAVLLTLVLHEIAHGYVAFRCGDPTAKMLGRLSLDPRKHLDPVGTVCLVLFGFGWAKPVPVNPRNFRGNYRRDDFLVSIAGIVTNLTLFIVSTALAVALNGLLWKPEVLEYYGAKELLTGKGFNALYFGDVNAELLQTPWLAHVQRFLLMFASLNVCVAVFNLLPIPPLDGYHLLNDTLLGGRFNLNGQVFQITQIILLVLCFTGAFSGVLSTVTGAIQNGVVNLFLAIAGQA